MKTTEAIAALTQLARGERRYSLENRETEEVLNLSLALLTELSVAFDRIDRLERVLAERTGIALTELRNLDYPDGPAADERTEATNALIARVLRIRFDPRSSDQTPRSSDNPPPAAGE